MSTPAPGRPRRVLIAGTAGAGKTTLAGQISAILGIPHTEIDGLHHGPQWTPRPEFEADVRALAAGEAWVTEWQYAAARPLLLQRAELLVWLDLPERLRMRRLLGRTVRRRIRRTVLWNGNVEPPLRTIFTDPDHIVRFGWRTRRKYRGLPERVRQSAPQVDVVRLRSQHEVESWLASMRCDV